MRCPNCENENQDDARFCNECGFPLSGAISRPAGSASPISQEEPSDSKSSEQASIEPQAPVRSDPVSLPTRDTHAIDDLFNGTYRWDDYENTKSSRADFDPWDNHAYPKGQDGQKRSLWPAVPDSREAYDIWKSSSFSDSEKTAALEPIKPRSVNRSSSSTPLDDEPAFDFDQLFDDETQISGSSATRDYDMSGYSEDPLDFEDGFWRDEAGSTAGRPDIAQAYRQDNYRAATLEQGTNMKTVAILASSALIAVAALVGIAGFLLGFWGGKVIPDISGKSDTDARIVLEGEGFATRIAQVKSDETEGLAVNSEPPAGSRAPEGSEVVVNIAVARFIPDVVGMTRDEAETALQEAGYEHVTYEPDYMDGEENIITSIAPEPGTRAKGNTEIAVRYSKHYTVPDIDGLDVDGIVKAIEEAGLIADIAYIDTDQYPDNTVVGTDPAPGTQVSQGATVTVTVSRTRGVELIALTEELFKEGSTVTIGGVDYEIESVISMSYQGDDIVAYTATAKPFVTLLGETLYASSSQTVSGEVTWSSDNEVVSID